MALPRIAILGGGVGAVSAAVQLSKPGWTNQFGSITLYQQGWRLGGKGACGRGQDMRIEEHGLHIWFGFYENAFRILDRCHRELDAMAAATGGPPRWPLAFDSVEKSFSPSTEIVLTDHDGCCWKLWTADFFDDTSDRPWADPDPRNPGERPDDWSVAFYLARCLRLGADLAHSLVATDPGLKIHAGSADAGRESIDDLGDLADAVWQALNGDLRGLLGLAADALDLIAAEASVNAIVTDSIDLLLRILDRALDFLRQRYDEEVRRDDSIRRAYYIVDLMIAIARGSIEDGLLEAGSFDPADDMDFRTWLLAHGAQRDSVDCALVRSVVYDLAFAFEGGDPQQPAAAAGTALRGLLRTFFTYRGAPMWKMNAGMGDIVFAPLYELLVKRGVDVRFFHRVEAVRAANGTVEEIEIDVQADMPAGLDPQEYLRGSAAPAAAGPAVWPSDPAPILANAKASASVASGEEYESWYAGRAGTKVSTTVLKHGAPDGFDAVVFGFPVACVKEIAPDLVAQSPRWAATVKHLKTVPTQAMQLWLDRSAEDLSDIEDGAVLGGYVEPYDTWADMAHLVSQEQVPGCETVAYFCNALIDAPPPTRGQAQLWLDDRRALVRELALRFLKRDIGTLWPKAVDPLTGEFAWERLIAPAGVEGEARLDHQYLRANVEPSERYVLSVPGSAAHRIDPGDTGFSNLYAVGDWTDCTLNAGCVEAAAISGMVAANAIHNALGDPANVEAITGREGP